jgi:thiol-disulfide isomerase/thioredoxin
LRGKVVLIDFWASWCGPCRKENPNVKVNYDKYKSKGFEILGVSLDRDINAWRNAIEQDGLTWHHVSDLKGWQSQHAALYSVTSIPQTVLIDKKGNIIARNIRGEQLGIKLKEIFGE